VIDNLFLRKFDAVYPDMQVRIFQSERYMHKIPTKRLYTLSKPHDVISRNIAALNF